jgi:hypothetical protein
MATNPGSKCTETTRVGTMGHMTCEPPDHETASPESSPAEEGPIELLQRWQRFGATWQVIDRTDTCVTISLCRCDGGEEAQGTAPSSVDSFG